MKTIQGEETIQGANYMRKYGKVIIRGRSQTYVYKIWGFFDYLLPPSVYVFYCKNVYKKSIFLTTYPLLL